MTREVVIHCDALAEGVKVVNLPEDLSWAQAKEELTKETGISLDRWDSMDVTIIDIPEDDGDPTVTGYNKNMGTTKIPDGEIRIFTAFKKVDNGL